MAGCCGCTRNWPEERGSLSTRHERPMASSSESAMWRMLASGAVQVVHFCATEFSTKSVYAAAATEEICSVAATRPLLEAAVDWVPGGDVLVVTKLDRLARSVAELVAITGALKRNGVELRILPMTRDTGGCARSTDLG